MPALIDGLFDCSVRIDTELSKLSMQNLNAPPGACWICTRSIRVPLMLEFEVEAEPVHPFEHLIGI
ncbi:hypothetical protein ASE43_02790 [Lysobacter sp. Root983]|nr:hypothetical protein ASE43_02790 [Lysobacter sp. Root983]